MQTSKIIHLLKPLLFMLNLFFTTSSSIAQDGRPTSFCGKIRIQAPFLNPSSNESSSLLHRMIQCKSQKLYFRTSLGLFPVSSINYTRKFLTISHRRSCSSSLHYVSPLLLSAGFPSPPLPNSLLLFNCSNKRHPISPFVGNCSLFHACGAFSSEVQEQQEQPKVSPSCLLVDDLERVGVGFDPKHLNCSHYSHIHRSLADDHHSYEGYELGTRISFDVPDHVPNPCDECEKPNGNCGVGLRCMCHPKECKNKVISVGGSMDPFGKLSREELEGVESVVRVAGGTIWGVSVLPFSSSRSTLFRQSLVDTRLPALLAVILRFCRCLLRPESSLLPGAWSSRARGFVTPWAACDDHVFASVAVLDGVRWI